MTVRAVLLALCLALSVPLAVADGLVRFCYDWSCKTPGVVSYPEPWLKRMLAPLRQAKTPEAERVAVAEVVRQFYVRAAEQTPIGADEPGNEEDETVVGRMDCIDHSSSTRNILSFLAHRQALRWHRVGPYAHRTLFLDSHYSATLIATDANAEDDTGIYTIDPWFVEQGNLPPVQPVREWASYRFYSLETQHHTAAATSSAGR
jgi:hypothetical protein